MGRVGDATGFEQVEAGGHRQAADVIDADDVGPLGVVGLPAQRFAAGDDDQPGVQLGAQVTQPAVGQVRPPGPDRCRDQRLVAVDEHHVRLFGAAVAQIGGENVGHGVGEVTVGQVVECLENVVPPYLHPAADVGRAAFQNPDQSACRAEERQAGDRVDDVGENRTAVQERQVGFVQP